LHHHDDPFGCPLVGGVPVLSAKPGRVTRKSSQVRRNLTGSTPKPGRSAGKMCGREPKGSRAATEAGEGRTESLLMCALRVVVLPSGVVRVRGCARRA